MNISFIYSHYMEITQFIRKGLTKMSEILLDFEIFELKSSVIKMNENN